MKSRYTNVKYHCEISWYFSVPCLPQSLRNYKEEAKIKPSEKALAMPGQKMSQFTRTLCNLVPHGGVNWHYIIFTRLRKLPVYTVESDDYVWYRKQRRYLLFCKDMSMCHHWNENVIILMKFSSLAAPKVVILTTFGAASDEDFIKMKTFSFQCTELPFCLLFCLLYCIDLSWKALWKAKYRQASNTRCALVGNKIAYHPDVVGASPIGTAPTKFSFST